MRQKIGGISALNQKLALSNKHESSKPKNYGQLKNTNQKFRSVGNGSFIVKWST